MKSFKNKVIMITGAASGIGQALAVAFSQRGAKLALSDILDLAETQEKCSVVSPSAEITTHSVDVSSQEAVAQWAKITFEHYGAIHMVINNAGIALGVEIDAMEYSDFERVMAINYWGVVYGTKECLPYLEKNEEAHVVNVSSLFGLIGVANQSAYCSAKFAVRGFTQSLQVEKRIAKSPVSFSYVCPGGIATNIVGHGTFKKQVGSINRFSSQESFHNTFKNKIAQTTADQAAAIIISGIEKKKLEIRVGSDSNALSYVIRYLPWLARRIVYKTSL